VKVFLDTNIVISYLDSQRADHEDAVKLIADFYKMDILMILSQDIMTNVIYNCTNKKQAVAYKYIRYLLYPMHKLNATACTSIINS